LPNTAPLPKPANAEYLHRSLGLVGVLTLSIGAMMGSGIFVLPSLAFKITGPGAVLAYIIAGLVVLPAVFSNAEMATAMPSAGGTYLYIDRAMGPMLGTIAGFGVWFSLTFKSAFALVGLGAYFSLFLETEARLVGLVVAALLISLNIIGVKQSVKVQTILVATVGLMLIGFIGFGTPNIGQGAFEPFLPMGGWSVLSAAAVVFVSYAGVTTIATIAEEVREPIRNIPRGMFASIVIMMLLYPSVTGIMIGVTPATELASTTTPIASAAAALGGQLGQRVMAITAVIALISMANAGLVASARYPFAMARNQLAPKFLKIIGKKSGAPTASTVTTGIVLALLIAFVPLLELAKLASAFQLLVFAFVNLALIAFRESHLDWYQPTYRSPLYPWIQIFGIFGSLLLLTQIGLIPMIGAGVFILAGIGWYRGFGKARVSRESAARETLRLRNQDRLITETRDAINGRGIDSVLVVLRRPTLAERGEALARLASHIVHSPGGKLHIMHLDSELQGTVPSEAQKLNTSTRGVELITEHYPGANERNAVHRYVSQNKIKLVLADLPRNIPATKSIIRDWHWLQEHLLSDSAFLRHRYPNAINSIAVMGTGGPYDPLKLLIASRIAKGEGASLRLIHVAQETASAQQLNAIEKYHSRLIEILGIPAESVVEPANDLLPAITRLSKNASLVILGAPSHRFHLVTDLADRIAAEVKCPTLLVHTPRWENMSFWQRMIERFIS
jgi:amino acid transporter/nucleotide-binding universal stress UspA family protein